MDRIEILPVGLLTDAGDLRHQFEELSVGIGIELGWHYLLDLIWAGREVDPRPGMRVLDAGAGVGPMQWWLAERGVNVLSVDRVSRARLPGRLRSRFRARGLRPDDLMPVTVSRRVRLAAFAGAARNLLSGRSRLASVRGTGEVTIYNQELSALTDIPDGSVDAVVSISAFEHNPPEALAVCVRADCPSNYAQYDSLFAALRDCQALQRGLVSFYYRSGNNGMPWGIWDPQYQPVGIVKTKGH